MIVDLVVLKISRDEWISQIRRVGQRNLLQTWSYGDARSKKGPWKPHRVSVINESDQTIAIAQFMTVQLPLIGGIAHLNRGPLFLTVSGFADNQNLVESVLNSLVVYARSQKWRIIQVVPELIDDQSAMQLMQKIGFTKTSAESWASGTINLMPDEDVILGSFDGKWRNSLRKGLRSGVTVELCRQDLQGIQDFLFEFHNFQENRGFRSLGSEQLISLYQNDVGDSSLRLFNASVKKDGVSQSLGYVLIAHHGTTCTYLAGISNDFGRSLQSNSVLLWHSILDAKLSGLTKFDLGGISESTPHGIASFKRRLNPETYSLIGEWRKVITPWHPNRLV